MIVVGSHKDSWVPYMRAGVLTLHDRASSPLDDFVALPNMPSHYRLNLQDGLTLEAMVDTTAVAIELRDLDGEALVHIRDETIALDAEDLSNVPIDKLWSEKVIGRWVELCADYLNIDPTASKTAQIGVFPIEQRQKIVATYQYAADHFIRSGHSDQLDLHLTLPTEYWSANLVASKDDHSTLHIAEDPTFSQLLEELPNACEIIAQEGQGIRMVIVPLYLTPVRINIPAAGQT